MDLISRLKPRREPKMVQVPQPGPFDNWRLWRRIALLAALPCVGLCMLNVYLKKEGVEHQPRPEFVPYGYLRRRGKRFPWGDGNKSLFHNSQVNPLPDGYEN